MKTLKVIGLIVLIFVAGFSGGVVATHIMLLQLARKANMHPEQTRTNIEQNLEVILNRRLGLGPQQHEQVHEILKDYREKMRAVREQVQPQVNALSLQARTNIAAVLRPGQQARLEQFLANNRQFLPYRELPPRQTNAPADK